MSICDSKRLLSDCVLCREKEQHSLWEMQVMNELITNQNSETSLIFWNYTFFEFILCSLCMVYHTNYLCIISKYITSSNLEDYWFRTRHSISKSKYFRHVPIYDENIHDLHSFSPCYLYKFCTFVYQYSKQLLSNYTLVSFHWISDIIECHQIYP